MTATRRFLPLLLGLSVLAACSSTSSSGAPATTVSPQSSRSVASTDPAKEATVDAAVKKGMTDLNLRSVIVRVTIDDEEIITKAYGESMTGVPATTDMHFRNGAVAIPYVSTVLLQLVDEGKVSLDDKVSTWLPEIPHSDEVTLGQLAQMTSGYTDYVINNPEVDAMLYADPFRQWTPEELLATVTSKPLIYPPGTNWNYAHTNYLILGLALEKITGMPMEELLQERVLGPLGLDNTSGNDGTPAIPEPVLHAFTSERRSNLGIPEGTGFYEESTFWNPSWTITRGAIQTTDIYDLNDTAVAIGTGKLLSPESFEKMTSTDLIGKTTKVPGCGTCIVQSEQYAYGVGLLITGHWFTQAPLFSGQGGAFAYLPSQKVAIAVAVTMTEDAFTSEGSYKPPTKGNPPDVLWRQIATALVPDDAPPPRP
jgi:CubicO group peptidase (beta-lactamase class C family)